MKTLLLCCALLFASSAQAGLIWQLTFGPAEDGPYAIGRGTLLAQLDSGWDSYEYDSYDIWHNVDHFALNIDGQHYQPEEGGWTREWLDEGDEWFPDGSGRSKRTGTTVFLSLQGGDQLRVFLSYLNDVLTYNSVGVYENGTQLKHGMVTSFRVLGVPEPDTISLLAAGLLALVVLRRRLPA